ncbi:MATE family efflux transporter [Fusobacterium simiae]|uniref:Multidrug export protein MepA n=1 Tax=Fusobacterium simiae TaxID=855 RepID=A0ABT4DHK8_FUSSI|nr:MATE family efflux transporter [Fusobacterium simiae]MCY7008087.1 MATE family efflux transporter [Fusobacterium simiae]
MFKKKIFKTIFKYAIPNVISMWIFTLYTMIDGVFISRFVGSTALAGVNLALPLINFIFSISIMIGVGSSTLIAIKFGENKYDEGNKIFTLATFLNLFLGIFISAMILLNIDRVINILGVNKGQEVYSYVKEYLTIIVLFSMFYMSGYAFEIYIKIDGKPSYPAICVLVGGLTNLILDYLFVVVFHYGVTGAAIATGISQVASCTLLFLYIVLKAKHIKFKKLTQISMEKISKIFKTGFSEFLTEISSGILILIYNLVILNKIGVLGVSIFGTVSYITSFITMTMIGFSQGIQPVISYYLGRKNHKNLKEILKISIVFLGLLGIFCSIFISSFSEYIGRIFFREENMIFYVKRVLRVYSLSYLIVGINIFVSAYFTAIKKVIYSALITFPRGILFNSILLLILPNIFGNSVIWIVSFLSELLTIFICMYLLKKIKREGILN